MDTISVTIVSLAIILYSLVSARLRQSVITAPIVFVSFGLLVGNAGFRMLEFRLEHDAIHLLAELALIVVLFTDASRIDLDLLRREHDLPVRLLMIGLPLCILIGTITAWCLFPAFGFWQAAVLAAIIAPTDAALAHAVVTNKLVPTRVRQAISVESGLNDGLCLPLFLIFLCGARVAEHLETTAYWVQFAAMQIGIGPLVGICVGYVGGKLIERSAIHKWISHSFLELTTIALALVTYGAAEAVGGNGFIAAFCAGLTVGNVSRSICRAIHEFADAEGQLLTLLVFLFFWCRPIAAGLLESHIYRHALRNSGVDRDADVASGDQSCRYWIAGRYALVHRLVRSSRRRIDRVRLGPTKGDRGSRPTRHFCDRNGDPLP
jgi:NhaP-type Na+/H+ or K+/H+ antiporter